MGVVRPSGLAPLPEEFEARYEVLEILGRGAQGEAVRARQIDLDRIVVVKLARLDARINEAQRERIHQEAALLAGLDHPNVLKLLDHGVMDGLVYMSYPDEGGEALDRMARRERRFTPEVVRGWTLELLAGLEAIHAAGIVHRDLKPGNVLRAADGCLKIFDFGLARDLTRERHLTATGLFIGTPAYSSPEQIRGEPPTPAQDLYSLGVMLYQLLTGTNPFAADNLAEVLNRHHTHRPPPLTEVRPEFPGDLSSLIEDLLAKSASQRPASAAAARARLEGAPEAAEAAPSAGTEVLPRTPTPTSTPEEVRAPARPGGIPWVPPLVALLLLAAGFGWMAWPGPSTPLPSGPPPARGPTLAQDLPARLGARLDRKKGESRHREPNRWTEALRGYPETLEFHDFLLSGGRPEEIPDELRGALREVDHRFRKRELPRPFYPWLYVAPRSTPFVPPDDPATRRRLALPDPPPGGYPGWFGRAIEDYLSACRHIDAMVEEGRAGTVSPVLQTSLMVEGLRAGALTSRGLEKVARSLFQSSNPATRIEWQAWAWPGVQKFASFHYALGRALQEEDPARTHAPGFYERWHDETKLLFFSYWSFQPAHLGMGWPARDSRVAAVTGKFLRRAFNARKQRGKWTGETRREDEEVLRRTYLLGLDPEPPGPRRAARILASAVGLALLELELGRTEALLDLEESARRERYATSPELLAVLRTGLGQGIVVARRKDWAVPAALTDLEQELAAR